MNACEYVTNENLQQNLEMEFIENSAEVRRFNHHITRPYDTLRRLERVINVFN